MTEHAIKRDIMSYGIISVKEERVEYIGSSTDASFILYDASTGANGSQGLLGPPAIEKSELIQPNEEPQRGSRDNNNLTARTDPRKNLQQSDRLSSKSPSRVVATRQFYNSTQPAVIN